MPEVPNIYLDDPDPLSEMLRRLELSAEVYVDGAFCGTWAVDTGGSRRIPFHLIGEGEAWLHFGQGEPTCLGEGDLVVFPHDAHHVIANSRRKPAQSQVNAPMSNSGATTRMICGFFEFRSPSVYPVLETLPATVLLSAGSPGQGGRVAELVGLLLAELASARPGHYAVIDQLAFLLFIEVLRRQVEDGGLGGGLVGALFDPRIGRVLTAIHRQPAHAWTVEALSDLAAMSRSSFSERFSALVGTSPMKYLASWRMSEARRLLTRTSLSVADIAERCGYQTEAAFRKAYRNLLGEPPGAARARAEADVA